MLSCLSEALVELEGAFDSSDSAGGVLGVVVRAADAPRRFYVKIYAVEDEYLRWHLLDSGIFGALTLFRLATNTAGDLEEAFEGEPQELAIS